MHSSSLLSALSLFAASALAAPLSTPPNYPAPNDPNPLDFAKLAGGGPPNGKLPPNVSSSALGSFGVVNFLENFESGFFEQSIEWIKGWNKDHDLDLLLDIVTTIHAQELIHVATAESILKNYNKPTFAPCKYTFPDVNNVQEFIDLANVITVTGIGAVINLASGLALTDPALVPGPASILGNEARQDAFFRLADATINTNRRTGDIEIDVLAPQPAAFDTRITAIWALNLASPFISDCPAPPPSFPKLPPMKADLPANQQKTTGSSGPIKFVVDPKQVPATDKPLFIGWANQANVIKYVPATLDQASGMIESEIPDGLAGAAFAALTAQNTFPDVGNLTAQTIAGPAVVMIS